MNTIEGMNVVDFIREAHEMQGAEKSARMKYNIMRALGDGYFSGEFCDVADDIHAGKLLLAVMLELSKQKSLIGLVDKMTPFSYEMIKQNFCKYPAILELAKQVCESAGESVLVEDYEVVRDALEVGREVNQLIREKDIQPMILLSIYLLMCRVVQLTEIKKLCCTSDDEACSIMPWEEDEDEEEEDFMLLIPAIEAAKMVLEFVILPTNSAMKESISEDDEIVKMCKEPEGGLIFAQKL